jgi:hypothetical protein|tara:strand:+ start:10889 stop:11020 length:132 start_codon:yes stop_codon:yes gene_type:complete
VTDDSASPIFQQSGHNAGDLVEAHQWKILWQALGNAAKKKPAR